MSDANKYQQLFLDEAQEHLQALNTALLKFEKKPNSKLAAEMMRSCHTIKGSAASMASGSDEPTARSGYTEIEELAHSLEDELENMKTRKQKNMKTKIDELFVGVDRLEALVEDAGAAEPTVPRTDGAQAPSSTGVKEPEGAELAAKPEAFAPVTTIRVGVEKLDQLMNLVEEFLVNRMRLGQIETNRNYDDLPSALDSLDRLVSDLQYNVMDARLVPVDQIFQRFPRMVRDLAKKEGKKVDLQISGSEIELDRTLLNQIGEPLVHLLRNAVDHGIEKAGTIKLSARREKGVAVIEVVNDGRPIDWEKIGSKMSAQSAAPAGGQGSASGGKSLPRGEALRGESEEELKAYLFSGISTKKGVSKISGRGVGLTVVKTKVEEVGGRVDVESPVVSTSEGAKFTLELPLTLAIAQALLVQVAGEKFAVPVADVDRLVRIPKEGVKKTADTEAAVVAGEDIPLVRLSKLFDLSAPAARLPASPNRGEPARQGETPRVEESEPEGLGNAGDRFSSAGETTILALLAKVHDQAVGFVVDEVLSEHDIIIKPLSGVFREYKGLSGVTILGDGSVVLILDIANLI